MKRLVRASGLLALAAALLAGGCAASAATKGSSSGGAQSEAAVASAAPRMKTIGIIGGVSWVSSLEYYRLLNEKVRDRFGPLNSAPILLYSIEFGEFSRQERLAERGDWRPLRQTMVDAAQRLERGGADFIVIASNTMNSTAELIRAQVKIPVLHIADATGHKIRERGVRSVALLGTAYTMGQPFYRERLEHYGIRVITPTAGEQEYINRVIFDELCTGKIVAASRAQFLRIIQRLIREEHAEGIILGCTEIPLLIKQADVSVPVFDTTEIHVDAAIDYALAAQ